MASIAAAIREVAMVPVYFTLPGNFWRLIPEWVKEPKFGNTPKSGRKFAKSSIRLFEGEMLSAAKIIPDLMGAGMHPSETFFLNRRDSGTRRVRITMRHEGDGEALTEEQLASLAPLWEENIWDGMSHRTSQTQFLPDHINVVFGNPFYAPRGGFDEVRCRDGVIRLDNIMSGEEQQAVARELGRELGQLSELLR